MRDLFWGGDRLMSGAVEDRSSPILQSLPIDPYVASSLLQKAIRRGDAHLAERAAVTLFRQRGTAVWRRLLVIAFEDVGIGSRAALVQSTAICTDPHLRSEMPGDETAARLVARLLAEAPKDRSADHLISAASCHPDLRELRQRVAAQSLAQRLDLVMDATAPLPLRAVGAWRSSGLRWGRERPAGRSDLQSLMAAFRLLGAPSDLVLAANRAARRSREPIVIMAPLLWLAASKTARPHIVKLPVPGAPVIDDVPMYAFDKHTAIGKNAIHRFARENADVRRVLMASAPESNAKDAACMAAFYADAAPVSQRFEWIGSAELEALGVEADMRSAGSPAAGVRPILTVVRAHLDHLNAIRARSFAAGRHFGAAGDQSA